MSKFKMPAHPVYRDGFDFVYSGIKAEMERTEWKGSTREFIKKK